MSSTNYATRDRDGTIHAEPTRKEALRDTKAYVWVVVDFLLALAYGIYRLARRS